VKEGGVYKKYRVFRGRKGGGDEKRKKRKRRALRRESEQYHLCIDFGFLELACNEILTYLLNNISLFLPDFHSRASPLLLFVSLSYKFIILG